jgi:hypothetical protein
MMEINWPINRKALIAFIGSMMLVPNSRTACSTESAAQSSTVMQAQQAAENAVERVIQFRHLQGLREVFGSFSLVNSGSTNAQKKQKSARRNKFAEEQLARIIENHGSQAKSTPLEPAPPLETSSSPEASQDVWFLWGFGAGARTGYDSYKMPKISWPGEEEVITRDDSFKPVAVKDQESFLHSQHIQSSAANAFMLGFNDGWPEGNAAASTDFPHLIPGERYDSPRCTPTQNAQRRINSLERLVKARAKIRDVNQEEASEIINQLDCKWRDYGYLFTKPAEKYSPKDMEILKLSWSQVVSSRDVIFLVKKFSYIPSARSESLEYIQQAAFADALAGRPWSAPFVKIHSAQNEFNQAILSNIFRVLADKLLIVFEADRTRSVKEQLDIIFD